MRFEAPVAEKAFACTRGCSLVRSNPDELVGRWSKFDQVLEIITAFCRVERAFIFAQLRIEDRYPV